VRKLTISILLVLFLQSSKSQSQSASSSRVDLDDVNIQGELLSDDRIRLLSRAKNSIDDEIKVRSSFREEMLEHLPEYFMRGPAAE